MISRMNAQSLCSFLNKAAYTVFTTPSEKARFQHLGKESNQLQLELSQNRKASSSCSFFSFFCFSSANVATKQANLQTRLTLVRAQQEQISASSVKRAYVVAGVVGVVALAALAFRSGTQSIQSEIDEGNPSGPLAPVVGDVVSAHAVEATESVVLETAARPEKINLPTALSPRSVVGNTSSLVTSEIVPPLNDIEGV